MTFDWLHIVLGLVSLVGTIAMPFIAKKNARLAAILGAVIQGVEQADHGPTKFSIQNVAAAEGVQDHLHELVQEQTKAGGA